MLKYLIESGKVDIEELKLEMQMNERKKFLDQHIFKIWQGTNGKWYTYLPDNVKGRVQKQRNTRKEIEDLVIKYYREEEENPTIKDIFNRWIDRKINNQEIEESTYTRYKNDFDRCFGNFGKRKIRNITELDIEDFLKSCVREKQMTRKAYANVRTLIYGIFRYAKKSRLIDLDIRAAVGDIDFSRKEFNTIVHEDIEQVFLDNEEQMLIDLMMENLDMLNLGILLMFKTGLRIGELTTLKRSDINGNMISIRRTETMFKDRNTNKWHYDVKEHPKTDAGIRDVILKNDYLWILKKIVMLNPFGEYLFEDQGERIKSYVFRNRLRTNCRKLNIIERSPHKVRKTYGTKLYDSKIPESVICSQMGHTDISCLKKYYYFNINSKNDMVKSIESVSNL